MSLLYNSAAREIHNPAQTSSSSKNDGPALRACVGAAYRLYAISQSDHQCFSHEDGCFAAGPELHTQPVKATAFFISETGCRHKATARQ